MPKTNPNGVELFHEETGAGEPLILVHGSWGDHFNWQGVAGELAKSFRVYTYDRRGHSQSERPGEGMRRDDEDDLAALIEQLGLAPAYVVGNSFGASICLGLAARRPELFKRLVVHEPPLMAIAAEDATLLPMMKIFQERIEKVIDCLRDGDIPDGARQFVENVAFGPGAWDRLPPKARETFQSNALTWLNEQDDPQWDSLDLDALSGYSGPILLSQGDQSPPWFGAIMSRLEKSVKRPTRHTFRGAGHVPHLTHPADYVSTVTKFLLG
jgi:pimeloyl-ACP methyl ester carboxylesterase